MDARQKYALLEWWRKEWRAAFECGSTNIDDFDAWRFLVCMRLPVKYSTETD